MWVGFWVVVVAEPSPKSQRYVKVSAMPGSVAEPVKETGLPSLAVWFGPAFAVGLALLIVDDSVSESLRPPLSVTVKVET